MDGSGGGLLLANASPGRELSDGAGLVALFSVERRKLSTLRYGKEWVGRGASTILEKIGITPILSTTWPSGPTSSHEAHQNLSTTYREPASRIALAPKSPETVPGALDNPSRLRASPCKDLSLPSPSLRQLRQEVVPTLVTGPRVLGLVVEGDSGELLDGFRGNVQPGLARHPMAPMAGVHPLVAHPSATTPLPGHDPSQGSGCVFTRRRGTPRPVMSSFRRRELMVFVATSGCSQRNASR